MMQDQTPTESETAPQTAVRSAVSLTDPQDGDMTRARVRTRARIPHLDTVRDLIVGDRESLWSESPASPAELARYARDGQWCAPTSVVWRTAGRAYCWLIAIPATILLGLAAHILSRPGRLAAALVLALAVWLSWR